MGPLQRQPGKRATGAQFREERRPELVERIFAGLRARVPRLAIVLYEPAPDGRVLLRSKDAPFSDPVLASFASDAREVLDLLGIERAHALGWSGGGPHVLSLAALLPDRIRSATSLAGVAPYAETEGALDFLAGMGQDNIEEFGAALEGEAPLREFLAPFVPALRVVTPAGIVEELASLLPEVDRAFCTDEHGGELARAFQEALVVSEDGWVDDDLAFVRPWGFDLDAIRVPVHVWQGSADLMVPFAHGEWLAGAVPGASVHLLDGEGHLSIGVGQAEAIVAALLASG